ncbi:MAG: EAL domain-containing protein [Candidatus Nanopelagicales bacterium]
MAGLSLVAVLLAVSVVLVGAGVWMRRGPRTDGLLANRDFVSALLRNSRAVVTVTDYSPEGDGVIVVASPMFAKLLGVEEEDIVKHSWPDVLGAQTGSQAQREDLQVLRSNRSQVFVTRIGRRGHRRTLMTTKFPVDLEQSGARMVGMVALDVTDHRRRDRIMRLSFDLSPVPMARLAFAGDEIGPILDANQALRDLLGVTVDELRGQDLQGFTVPEDLPWTRQVRADGRGTPQEVQMLTAGGRSIWVSLTVSVLHDRGEFEDDAFSLAVLEDITARRLAEQTLKHQARHDALTGLPNRYALVAELEAALERLWGSTGRVAVMFCDVDGFKTLNDTLSHRAGDEVLVAIAQRLREAVRPTDTVARLGGDEFVVIAEQLASGDEALAVAGRLCQSVQAPFSVQGRDVGLGLSVGVTVTSDPRATSEDLLRQADLAMYRAKDKGRNRVEVYEEVLEAVARGRLQVRECLREAIADSTVRVEYQPIVAVDGSGVSALEALVRIPAAVPTDAATFVAVAEQTGLIGALGREVLRVVAADMAKWRDLGLSVRVHLNLSPSQLADPGFPHACAQAMAQTGVPVDQVCFEVSDTPALSAWQEVVPALRHLRNLGFHVGIDGFGAGHSGLTSLKELAADYLKIDRSFIERLDGAQEDQVIVEAVIRVAHDLGRNVIATGVERPAQAEILRRLGCDEIQGYVHSAPVGASRVEELVTAMR